MAKSILIVEDHRDLGISLKELLIKEGFEVEVVLNAQGALDTLKSNKPDLILLDILLPDKTGLELLDYFDDDQKVIVMTNLDSPSIAEIAKKRANDFFMKATTDLNEIVQKIKSVIEQP